MTSTIDPAPLAARSQEANTNSGAVLQTRGSSEALAALPQPWAAGAATGGKPISTSHPASPGSVPSRQSGRLGGQAVDTMTLHTREAWRLFVGRPADAARRTAAIPGARRCAAALRAVWMLSAHDNPYADWFLVRAHEDLSEVRAQIEQGIAARQEEFDRLGLRGLNLSVIAASQPMTVELGFGSPYGYAAAQAVMAFDMHVRMVLSLVRRDRLSDEAGHAAIAQPRRRLRRLFLESTSWERGLRRDELLPLSRRDYLPDADEAAQARVRAAVALFGDVPQPVLMGQVRPRHSLGRRAQQPGDLRQLKAALGVSAPAQIDAPGQDSPVVALL